MELSSERIVQNWNSLLSIIEENFSGTRKTNLLKLYKHFEDRMVVCPASSKDYYHNAFPGGYVLHILNVINFTMKLDKLWIEEGAIRDYDYDSLIFVALNHDLGKIGDIDQSYYVTHNQKWRKDRGEVYVINIDLRFMTVPDRSIWLLQHFDIKFTESEMIAIRLHDGMYDDGNKPYLVSYTENKQLRDNLPIIIHHADMLATISEKNHWKETKKQSSGLSDIKTKVKSEELRKITQQFFKGE